ncbi:MAG: SAM-dependent methyltransferase [Candidatus Promineifilaceae bacterium]
MKKGSLIVVGSGIQYATHLTAQAERFICEAEKVLYVIPGAWGPAWMTGLNASAESLIPLYHNNNRRADTYGHMVERILSFVRQGMQVCAVFYGHPGVFVVPSHAAIRQAHAEGFDAWMCPGISAEDCLFADLGVDPAQMGCQSYEATDFLIRHRRPDPHAHLVIWQIGVIGHLGVTATKEKQGLCLLVDVLAEIYTLDHEVVLYEAAPHPNYRSRIEPLALRDLPEARLMSISTLYVPPTAESPIDEARLALLGLHKADLEKRW